MSDTGFTTKEYNRVASDLYDDLLSIKSGLEVIFFPAEGVWSVWFRNERISPYFEDQITCIISVLVNIHKYFKVSALMNIHKYSGKLS